VTFAFLDSKAQVAAATGDVPLGQRLLAEAATCSRPPARRRLARAALIAAALFRRSPPEPAGARPTDPPSSKTRIDVPRGPEIRYIAAMIDRGQLAGVPTPELGRSPAIERGIADSVAYLGSDAALRSIEIDTYWPKWHSPWWHMLLLHELGEAAQIPGRTVAAMVTGLDALPLHIFPIHPGDAPPGTDLWRDVSCHCALGCMYQVLSACGVDVDHTLPWIPAWFVRYQMADGGLNCDELAYRAAGECPSSMVGTIAPLEAMLVRGGQPAFVERAAKFLIERALTQGSTTLHNAAERDAAPAWRHPTFPRFYFYDTLRGLAALVRWAEATGAALLSPAVADVVDELIARFPDGVIRIGRRAHDGMTTRLPTHDRTPSPRAPASRFPLLDAASVLGEPSQALTRQWAAARHGLVRLLDAGRVAD
jgi:hypothetical protein